MSFLSSIGHIIHPVAQVVSALNIPIVSQVASVVAQATANKSSTSGSIFSSIGNLLGNAGNSVLSTIESLAGGINSLVNEAKTVESSFISPISKAINSVTSLARNINDGLIQPIVGPIDAILNAQKSLTVEIHDSLKNGLQGLVQVPAEIANALTSIDASFQRSNQELALNQQKLAKDTYLPAFPTIASEPINKFTQAYVESQKQFTGEIGIQKQVHINTETDAKAYIAQHKEALKAMAEGGTWFDKIAQAFYVTFDVLEVIGILNEPINERVKQLTQSANPYQLLTMAEAIEAEFRGIITQADREAEGLKHGFDIAHQKILKEAASWLVPENVIVTWYARGAVTNENAIGLLTQHRMTKEEAQTFLDNELEIVGPRSAAEVQSRKDMAAQGFLQQSLTSDPPEEVRAVFDKNYLDPQAAEYEWLAHWRIPAARWWVSAVWRGIRTREEAYAAFRQENIPQELFEDIFGVESKLWELWLVPDVVAAGVGNDAYWLDQLAKMGFDATTSQVVLDYGKSKSKASKAATAGALQKLSLGNAKTLYDDGGMTKDQYTQTLIEHGYSQEAASLTVELADIENAIKARTTYATGLVDDVKLGLTTIAKAEADLYANGFTEAEVSKYLLKMGAAKKQKIKLPSRAELDKMVKTGVIDQLTWEEAMLQLGYDPNWIPRIYEVI